MSNEQGNKPSFWQTLPGILTAAAGVIAGVTALIAALNQAGIVGNRKADLTAPTPHDTSSMVKPAGQERPQAPTPSAPKPQATIQNVFTKFQLSRNDPSSQAQSPTSLEESVEFTTAGKLKLRFEFASEACSEIRIHLFVDDKFVLATPFFNKFIDGIDLGAVAPGRHTLRLRPEGQVGGCNSGRLQAWGGTLTLETSERQVAGQ